MRCRSILVSSLLLLPVIGGCAATWSTTPSSTTRTTSASEEKREVTGRIASYTTTPKGDMDGFILDTGNKVHFPPNTGSALLPYVQKDQEVKVIGKLVDRPDGKVIEASSITNVAKRETINVASIMTEPEKSEKADKDKDKAEKSAKAAPPAAGNAAPPAKSQPATTLTGAELTTKEGKVNGYTTTSTGDMDGVLLDNGSRVHFPAHAGKAVLPLVGQGKIVKIIGWELTTPQGTLIEATKIISPDGTTVDISAIPLPSKPPAEKPAPEKAPIQSTPR